MLTCDATIAVAKFRKAQLTFLMVIVATIRVAGVIKNG